MPELIGNADLGVVPKRADSFGNEAYSTKIMEFLSQGVPAVVSRTKIDTYYFDDETVRFFPSGDSRGLADAILEIMNNPNVRANLIAKGLDYVKKHNWDRKKAEYLKLVDTLTTEIFPGTAEVVARKTVSPPAKRAGREELVVPGKQR